MKIGIIGAGDIGGALTRKLSSAGHEVKVANSRGPDAIPADLLTFGARAVDAAQAVVDVDVIIVSIPLNRIPAVAPLIAAAPAAAVVIDTSNYYPFRDGKVEALEAGEVESVWVAEQLGRSVVKAWNSITAGSLVNKAEPAGSPKRVAIPVAGDREENRRVAMALVEDTGLDAYDAGVLAGSWRQQPGAPCYCTDLIREEMTAALAAANPARLPIRRDLAIQAIQERASGDDGRVDADYLVRLTRALFT